MSTRYPSSILIAHRNQIYLAGLNYLLKAKQYHVSGNAHTGIEVLSFILKNRPDIVILDCELLHLNAIDIIKIINKKELGTKFIVIFDKTDHEYIPILKAFRISGMLLISDPIKKIEHCIEAIFNGSNYVSDAFPFAKTNLKKIKTPRNNYENLHLLSNTEILVLSLIGSNMDISEIQKILHMPESEISMHQYNIKKKLGLKKEKASIKEWLLKYKSKIEKLGIRTGI